MKLILLNKIIVKKIIFENGCLKMFRFTCDFVAKITQSMIPNHNGIKLEINIREMSEKSSNIRKVNSIILNNPHFHREIQGIEVK